MNLSGEAVAPLVRRHGIDDPQHLVIVHDELDLPVGTLKVKVGGGLAGNNGLKSIKAHLHTDDFVRVRIGIGKPPGKAQGADHVLKRPGKAAPPGARRDRAGGGRRGGAHPHRRPRRGDEPLQHARRARLIRLLLDPLLRATEAAPRLSGSTGRCSLAVGDLARFEGVEEARHHQLDRGGDGALEALVDHRRQHAFDGRDHRTRDGVDDRWVDVGPQRLGRRLQRGDVLAVRAG